MQTPLSVRALRRTDLPDLVQLCREHADYEGAAWEEYEREEPLGRLLLQSQEARCWVAASDAGLAGFATVALQHSTWAARRYGYLDCLYLRPPFRGQGLGRALLREVACWTLEAGVVELQWQTPTWNADAARFYASLGARAAEKLRFTLGHEETRRLADPQ